MMKKTIRYGVMMMALALLTACASGPTIQTDYDHSIDFSKYKTYGYFSPMGIENHRSCTC